MSSTITHVVFHSIHPHFEIVVPVAEAFAFYESNARMQRATFDAIDREMRIRDEGVAAFELGVHKTHPDFFHRQYERNTSELRRAVVSLEVSHVIWDNDPREVSFASTRTVWDFESLIHRLAKIVVGCFSEVTLNNPAVSGERITTHLVDGHLVSGINWERRAACYRKEEGR